MPQAASAPPQPTKQTLRRPTDLVDSGLVGLEKRQELEAVAAHYAIAITPDMVGLIDPQDPDDPIARQFLPDADELVTLPLERADPIGDGIHEVIPGVIHRYPDRILLKFINVCAVYCRFCFRREMVGPQAPHLSPDDLSAAFAYIRSHPEIWEVIVSGGDPLVASPRRIADLVQSLAGIDHVKIVRYHTRVPIVAPDRVTDSLIGSLCHPGLTTWIAIHANHPREFTPDACAAIGRLADAGIPLVSQTVLLAGVNDDTQTLGDLMRSFVENRVKPYYLHHGDLAPGTRGFRTSIAEGQDLMRTLRGSVSGLCQPTYVLDIPGGHGKAPIGPCSMDANGESTTVTDYRGRTHAYPPEKPRKRKEF